VTAHAAGPATITFGTTSSHPRRGMAEKLEQVQIDPAGAMVRVIEVECER